MGTPSWPPNAPPFAALVRAYTLLVRDTARRWGVRPAEVEDCTQEVLLRFYRAILQRRLDASRPRGIGGWLKKTTGSVARDLRALRRREHEVLATPDALDRVAGTDNPEGRMAVGMDVHDIVDRILEKLPPEQRDVFMMHDLEDTDMDEVAKELEIPVPTAYYRLNAARAAFAREWEAMQASHALPAPLAGLTVGALLAADHAIPDALPSDTDELLRRLGKELGQDFRGPAGGAVSTGAAAAAVKAGSVTLTVWQLGLGVLLAALAGAGLVATLRPAGAMPPPSAVVVLPDAPSLPVPAPSPTVDPAPLPPGAPADVKPSAPPPSEIQTRFLASARALLEGHQPAKALALLARVTAPDLAEERDDLRRLALARLQDAGRP